MTLEVVEIGIFVSARVNEVFRFCMVEQVALLDCYSQLISASDSS